MAAQCVSMSLAARPTPTVAGAKRSAFCAGARLAPLRAANGALLTARSRQAAVSVQARATKAKDAAGAQITVDVEKPLGLVGAAARMEAAAAGCWTRAACRRRRCRLRCRHSRRLHTCAAVPTGRRCWTRAKAPRAASR